MTKRRSVRSEQPARLLSLLLALVLVIGICVPTAALAEQNDEAGVFDASDVEAELGDLPGQAATDDAGSAGQGDTPEPSAPGDTAPPASEGAVSPQDDATQSFGPAATEADFAIDSSGVIIGYTGSDMAPVIPATINGRPVIGIGSQAFRGLGLTGVTLPEGISSIGESAFAENSISSIALPRSLRTIGKSAFAYNRISKLELPASLQAVNSGGVITPALGEYAFRGNRIDSVKTMGTIAGAHATNTWPSGIVKLPAGVFMQNNLSKVSADASDSGIPPFAGSNLGAIGNSAFELNSFKEVEIPDTLTYGDEATAEDSRVFANNGRYVLVSGNNSKIASYTVADAFGEMKAQDLAQVNLECFDEKGVSIFSNSDAADLTLQVASIANLPIVGNSYTVSVPELAGMAVVKANIGQLSSDRKSLTFTIAASPADIRIDYHSTNGAPVLSGLKALNVARGGNNGRITEADVLAGVTATTVDGTLDITQLISAAKPVGAVDDPSTGSWYLDTNVVGSFVVSFTVTDPRNGISANGSRAVNIGFDIAGLDIGNGWTYEDFTYKGDAVTGLSAFGKAKLAQASAKADIWLPEFNTNDPDNLIPLKRIGVSAFLAFNATAGNIHFERLAPTLEVIENNAFGNYDGSGELDFSILKNLRVIGVQAFVKYQGRGTVLSFNSMPSLEVIDSFAFWAYKGINLELNDLPKLRQIKDSAFQTFVGPSCNLSLAGLDALEEIGTWAFTEFQGTSLTLRDLPRLERIGLHAFTSYSGKDLILDDMPSLEDIGNWAFERYVGSNKTLSFTGMPSLKNIGASAFLDFKGSELVFGSHPHMSTFGESAFANYKGQGKTLNLSGMPELKTIGRTAFSRFNGSSLVFGSHPKLETIGVEAFMVYIGRNAVLDLSDMPSLETIDTRAFNYFNGKDLVFGSSKKLKTIGEAAFKNYGDSATTPLDLGDLPGLETIGKSAFANYNGPELYIGQMPNLKSIGKSAFSEYGLDNPSRASINFYHLRAVETLEEGTFASYLSDYTNETLDLSGMQSLTKIESHVFSVPSGSVIYLPASLTDLDPKAFRYIAANKPNYVWYAYTRPENAATTLGQQANPITYSDNQSTGAIYINKVTANGILKDTAGNVFANTTILVDGSAGMMLQVYAPDYLGHVIDSSQAGLLSNQNSYYKNVYINKLSGTNVEFIYGAAPQTADPALQNVKVELQNVSDNGKNGQYRIGEDMKLQLSISSSGQSAATLPAGSCAVIPLSRFSENVAVARSSAVESTRIEHNRLIIVFKQASLGSGAVTLEFSQRYNSPNTPWGFTDEFSAELFDPTGALVSAFDKGSGATLPTLKAVGGGNATLTGLANGSSNAGDPVDAGHVAMNTQHPSKSSFLVPGSERDVVFTWRVGTVPARVYEGVRLVVDLPTYMKKDDTAPSGESLALATFDEMDNSWWTFDASNNTIVFEQRFSHMPLSSMTLDGLELKLRFPEARVYQEQDVTVNSRLELDVYHDPTVANNPGGNYPPEDKSVFSAPGTAIFKLAGLNVQGLYGMAGMNPHFLKTGDPQPFFYDDDIERDTIFDWDHFFVNKWSIPFYDVAFEDFDLDDCMYYYGVKNQWADSGYGMHVTALDASGNKLYDADYAGRELIFPASIAQGAIKSVKVSMLGGFEIPAGTTKGIIFSTKIKSTYASSAMYDVALPNGHRHSSTTVGFENKSYGYMSAWDQQSSNALPASYKIQFDNQAGIAKPVCTLGVGKQGSVAGKGGTLALSGDSIDYKLGVFGERNPAARIDNFKMVDLLPTTVNFVSVTPLELFKASVNAKVEVKDNYNGSGQTAVIFTADQLLLDKSGTFGFQELGKVRVEKTPMPAGSDGWFNNDVYMQASYPVSLLPGSGDSALVAKPEAMGNSNPASHSAVALNSLRSSAFTIVKQVGQVGGPFTSDGIETAAGSAFQYKFNLYNPDENSWRDQVVIYDVFPFVGDDMMDAKSDGSADHRGSQFANALIRGIEDTNGSGVFPAGTQFLYTTDRNATNDRSFVNDASNWQSASALGLSTEAQWATVTGFKIVMPSSWKIAANSQFSFLADVRAPLNPSGGLTYLRAWNSFAVTDNVIVNSGLLHDPVESNRVWNSMATVKGSIVVLKTGEDGQTPLAGAVLALVDANTKLTVQAQGSDANGVVTFKDVVASDYYIIEVSAPSGYVVTTDKIEISSAQLKAAFGNGSVVAAFDAGVFRNYKTPPAPDPSGTVNVKKANASGAALAGAVFQLTGPSYPADQSISIQRITTAQGMAVFNDMPLGTYLLEELSAPGHLQPTFAPVAVTITSDGEVIDYPSASGAIVNDKASIDLVKIGIYSSGFMWPQFRNSQLDASMGRRLEGVEFQLYEGTVAQYVGGQQTPAQGVSVLPSNGKTDNLGRMSFSGLVAGKHYTLVETAPAQYPEFMMRFGSGPSQSEFVNDDTQGIYEVWVSENGDLYLDSIKINSKELVIGNDVDMNQTRLAFMLHKVDQDGNPLAGAKFLLTPTFAPGATVPSPLPTKEVVSDASGEIFITLKDLKDWNMPICEVDSYDLTEIEAPAGYTIDPVTHSFTWNSPACFVPNHVIFTAVNKKTELDVFKYTKVAGTVAQTMQYLKLGSELNDIFAAHGGAEFNVAIADLSAAQLATIESAVAADPTLRLERIANGTQLELRRGVAGASIHVQEQGDPTNGFTAVTDAFGRIPVPAGYVLDAAKAYEVFETKAPAGFKLNSKVQVVKPGEAAKVAGFDGKIFVGIENIAELGNVTVTKLTAEDGDVMAGVSFRLAKKDGSWAETKTTDANGLVSFPNLEYGDYILTETATQADYELLQGDVAVTVSQADNRVFLTLHNTRKTGSITIDKYCDNGTPADPTDDYPLAGMDFALEKWNPLIPVPGVSGLFGSWEPYEGTDAQGDFGMDLQDPNDGTGYYPPRTSDAAGHLSFGNLPQGRYRIMERLNSIYGTPTFTFVSTGNVLDGALGNEFTLDKNSPLSIAIKAVNPLQHGSLEFEKTVADGGDKDAYFTFRVMKRVPGANGAPSTLVPVDLTSMPHGWDAIAGVDMPNDGDNNNLGMPELGYIQLKHGQKFIMPDVLVGDYVIMETFPQGYTTQWRVVTSPITAGPGLPPFLPPVGPPGLPPFLPPTGPGTPSLPDPNAPGGGQTGGQTGGQQGGAGLPPFLPPVGPPGLPPFIRSHPLVVAMETLALYGLNDWTDGLNAEAPVEGSTCTTVEFLNTPEPDATEPPDAGEPPATTDPPANNGGWTGGTGNGKLPHTGIMLPASLAATAILMLVGLAMLALRKRQHVKKRKPLAQS